MGKKCLSCTEVFVPHVCRPDQSYCRKAVCQRERRRCWHQQQQKTDSVYRQGQSDCQKSWRERNQGYWRKYRERHPDYCERNRQQQAERNRRRRGETEEVIAKMDELTPCNDLETGKYILAPYRVGMIAKMDELIVQLSVVPSGSPVEGRAGP